MIPRPSTPQGLLDNILALTMMGIVKRAPQMTGGNHLLFHQSTPSQAVREQGNL